MNDYSTYPQQDKSIVIPVTGKRAKPRRVTCCEVCGAADQVRLTADADRGGLQLCADCRRLFGFEGADNGN